MTSGTVSGSNLYIESANYASSIGKQIANQQSDFSQFMNQSNQNDQTQVKTDKSEQIQSNQYETNSAKNDQKITKKVESKRTGNDHEQVEDVSKIQDEVMEQVDALKTEIAESLGVTVEKLEQVMSELNLEDIDLLNVDLLATLVTQVCGEQDLLGLVTNEELYVTFQDLSQKVVEINNELTTQFGISNDELQAVMQQMVSNEEEPLVQTLSNTPSKETVATNMNEQIGVKEGVQDQSLVSAEDGEEIVPVKVVSQQGNQSTNQQELSQETSGHEFSGNQETEEGPVQIVGVTDQVVQKLNTIVNDTVLGDVQNTEHIMKQLVDYIKVNANPTVTEMELQLQPANLGSVQVQVALKDGQLTAQFRAQNEVTREAIENQMVQLKQTLQEQGIKVEAIEVTIASHEFERNLEQNQPGHQEQQSEGNSKRKVSLDMMNELDEDLLTEEEQILVDMMKENGNTVDYIA